MKSIGSKLRARPVRISGFVVVPGAEINAEMERQTARDTTEGPEKAMGDRGAYAAATLGESPVTR